MIRRLLICTAALVLFLWRTCNCEDVLGCGGFLKSEIGINFSLVEVKLYTKQGSLKYQTDCAPNNGYYLIPLYDKGDYVLKVEPPPGWSFEPKSVPLHVDGKNDPCSRGQDINFYFKGFSVVGKVISYKNKDGPEGVKVSLLDSKTNAVLQVTTTAAGGVYGFQSVLPGEYAVTASHPKWTLRTAETRIKLVDNNGDAGSDLVVAGYDVAGQVTSDGEPIRGVKFILFSPTVDSKDIDRCVKTPIDGYVNAEKTAPLCHMVSQEDGQFVFPVLLPGEYTIIPFYKGEQIKFDVVPAKMSFALGHQSLVLTEKFKVQGFSVGGRVVSQARGKGIAGARVMIDGRQEAETRSDGQFHLENMKAGTYSLQVMAENIFFDIVQVKITPNTPQLPEIVAKSFNVCGQLQVTQLPLGMDTQARRLVTFRPTNNAAAQSLTARTGNDGHFCVQLTAGKYDVAPTISEAEATVGLRLLPVSRQITVVEAPVMDLVFKQFFATVGGAVKCFGACTSVRVAMKALNPGFPQPMSILVPGNGKFTFDSVMPGDYRLTVSRENWCWKPDFVEVKVGTENVKTVQFTQTGYTITIQSSHATELKYTSKEANGVLAIQKGLNYLCLDKPGVYDIQPVGCHVFADMKYSYNTERPVELTLIAIQHLLTGKVISQENATDIKITVSGKVGDGEQEDKSDIGPLKGVVDADGKTYVYRFTQWVQYGTNLQLKPSASRLLFDPSHLDVQMPDGCYDIEGVFMAYKGLFLSGAVHPPLAGVAITVATVDETLDPVTVETAANGHFQAGPLPTNRKYELSAHKNGYILSRRADGNDFDAFKLAEIITDVTTDGGEPLAGVLLSLSGGSDYRQNTLTQENGQMIFQGLSPGQYFLRPVLKEYSFNPSSTMVDVKEGASINVKLVGSRVAYSCYGFITSLTGEAETGILVEAVGVGACNASQEEATSEADGSFRIRGLLPKCVYAVGIKASAEANQHIERATPVTRRVKVDATDIYHQRIVVFRQISQMDISGNVVVPTEHLSTLKVRLLRDDGVDHTVHTLTLATSNFFHFPSVPLDGRTYMVRLETTLSRSLFDYALPQVVLKANTSYRHISLEFAPRSRAMEHDTHQGSFWALPFAILVVVVCCGHQQLLPLATQVADLVQSAINPVARNNGDNNSGAAGGADTVDRRKKVKPRKTQ